MAPSGVEMRRGRHGRPAALHMPDHVARRVRGAARIWGVAVTLALLAAAVAGQIPQSPDSRTFEAAGQLGMLGLAAVGGLVALRWEGVGAGILIVSGVALGVLASLQWPPLVALLVALAFVTPAVAFLVLWQRERPWRHLAVLGVVVTLVLAAGGAASSRVYANYFGPAHPQSSTEVATSDDVPWLWSGGVTPTGFRVTARLDDADLDVGLRVTDAEGRPAGRVAAPTWDAERRTASFDVDGLAPGRAYAYAVVIDGVADDAASGVVRTLPEEPVDLLLAVSSCARVGSNGQVFDAIRALDPDLYVVTGDLHYGDVASDSTGAFQAVLRRTLAAPAQAALYRSVPVAYTWDDHDYGTNDGDRTATARTAALEVYRTAVPHYPLALPGDDAPIAQATTIGRVRLVLTDLRSARDPAGTPGGSMMGAEQLAWFRHELTTAARDHALVVWASSVPWIGEATPGADDWSGYPEERDLIARTIADAGIPVLVLGGDAHMLAIDDGTNAAMGTGADLTVLQAGALDRPGSVKGGPYSHGTAPGGGQFGVVRIQDEGDTLTIELQGRDWTGRELLHHRYVVPAPREGVSR